jgi:tetratricopeptide (TPR) repeat protein
MNWSAVSNQFQKAQYTIRIVDLSLIILILRFKLRFVRNNERANVGRHVQQLQPLFFIQGHRKAPHSVDYASAYNNRGNARRAKGDLDGAIGDLDQAIRLDTKFAVAYHNRGLARRDKGNLDGAIADYDEATRLNPNGVILIT